MKKTLWAAVVNEPEQGKYTAFTHSFNRNTNLVGVTDGCLIFHLCESKKEAVELADYWNECYKNNGTLWEG